MAVAVRRGTRNDAATVAKFAIALFELHVGWDPKRFTQIATVEGAANFYGERAGSGSILVAEDEGGLVGFAYFEYELVVWSGLATNAVMLHDLFVEEDARGEGAGKALLAAVREEARRLGADKVLLSVAVGNELGRKTFERFGFETTMHEMMLGIDNE